MLRPSLALRLACLALLFFQAAQTPATAQQSAGLPADQLTKIESAITALMAQQHIPALSVAIVTEERLRFSKAFGLADLENNVPAKSLTVYRLASVSKPITATAAMQLVERGKLSLDVPLQKYCPAFPVKPWPMTARQLLGHLSGIRHYKGLEEVLSTRHYDSITEALDIFKNDALLFEPGTKYSYTTYGYTLLGCVIEGAAGMKYMDYVRANVLKPARMDHTYFDDVYQLIPNRSHGYDKTDSGELQNAPLFDASNKIPGGGILSTAEDLAYFAIAVQKGELVSKQTLAQMWTQQKPRDEAAATHGLGWGIADFKGRHMIGYGGDQPGGSSVLYMLPEKGYAVVLLVNLGGQTDALFELAAKIADVTLR